MSVSGNLLILAKFATIVVDAATRFSRRVIAAFHSVHSVFHNFSFLIS